MQKINIPAEDWDEMAYAAALIHRLSAMDTVLLGPDAAPLDMWPEQPDRTAPYPEERGLITALLAQAADGDMPAFQSSPLLGNFFAVTVRRKDTIAGTLVVGPSMTGEVNDSSAAMLQAYDYPVSRKRELTALYRRMPVVDYRLFIEYALTACCLLNGSRYTVHDLVRAGRILSPPAPSHGDRAKGALPHPETQAAQEALLACIRRGDKAGLTRALENAIRWSAGPRAKLPLRAAKNQSIGLCALALQAATDAGADWQATALLGEYFIQCIEEMETVDDVTGQTVRMLFRFCAQVEALHAQDCSPLIRRIRAYVSAHLHETLTVSTIAEALSRNGSYLSARFRRETGQTLTRYILACRVEEAKRMLEEETLSLSEIWSTLGFYDQSHFTHCFKEVTGLTPRAYRDQKKRKEACR